jgi:short-subunit dehydrogenase
MKNAVLVTGACINTGVAIVEKFASEGYNVIFTGRNQEKVHAKEAEYTATFKVKDAETITFESLGGISKIDLSNF